MNIIHSPRGAGKTTKAIEWLKEDLDKRVLITYSHNEENRLKQIYPECAHRIVDWESYLRSIKQGGSSFSRIENPRLMIDNADLFIQKIFDWHVTDLTFTKDEIDLRDQEN